MHLGANAGGEGSSHGQVCAGSNVDDTCPAGVSRRDLESYTRTNNSSNSDSDRNSDNIVMVKLTPDGVPIDTYLRSLKAQDGTIKVRDMIVMLGDDRGLSEADLKTYEETAAEFGVPITPVSLGGAMLLASHCIVLVQHYIDVILHTCPAKLWERPPREVVQLRKKAQRRKKRRNKDKKNTNSNQPRTVQVTGAQALAGGQILAQEMGVGVGVCKDAGDVCGRSLAAEGTEVSEEGALDTEPPDESEDESEACSED
jgi:hypothetical protein